jgi:hypothetical protein
VENGACASAFAPFSIFGFSDEITEKSGQGAILILEFFCDEASASASAS